MGDGDDGEEENQDISPETSYLWTDPPVPNQTEEEHQEEETIFQEIFIEMYERKTFICVCPPV